MAMDEELSALYKRIDSVAVYVSILCVAGRHRTLSTMIIGRADIAQTQRSVPAFSISLTPASNMLIISDKARHVTQLPRIPLCRLRSVFDQSLKAPP
jgi:hypothetical protein